MRLARADVERYAIALAKQRWLWAGVLSGAAFLAIFGYANPLPHDAYSYRDDAIITLSHARNLVDYGSIGVDGAGARVEGFSAPLQFWIFAGVYALTHCGYPAFLDWQTYVCTFLLGFAVVQLFRERWLLGVVCACAIAWSLAKAVRFIGWHGSGMENAYTHVLFSACVAAAWVSIESARVRWYCAPLFVLACLTRIESVVHVAPLLVVWSLAFWYAHRSFGALRASGVVLACFAAYQLFRFLYFGDLRPNTALAEGIDVVARLRAFWRGDTDLQLRTAGLVRHIMSEHRGYLALFAMPLLMLVPRRTGNVALVGMLVCLFASAIAHPVVFGPARLDPVRTTSHLALIAPLLIATQWMALPTLQARALSFAGLGLAIGLYAAVEPPAETFFCCPIGKADRIAEKCLQHAQTEGLTRPSLASPDLGKMSFKKSFLMFDLGRLGSPPLARLQDDQRAAANYLLELAQPDYVELHGGWTCEYGFLQQDPRFAERYVLMPGMSKLRLKTSCRGIEAGVWFRKDMAHDSGSAERKLVDDLSRTRDASRVAEELRRCKLQPGESACAYVSRSVYRFLPEIRRDAHGDELLALFTSRYDRGVLALRNPSKWYVPVIDLAKRL
ncbi:MAG TPA: hypothetical protein VJV78_17110 [Polyangiales bacterium]|nr:hypothetical protein [Polyangiales bacterium]